MSGKGRLPVKVKIIKTQFVQTDARSFKSVVQGLTGRDSSAAAAVTPSLGERVSYGGKEAMSSLGEGSCGSRLGNPQLEEMERLFLEMPTIDDLFLLCVD